MISEQEDQEEISDECNNLCFGRESLIQPLSDQMKGHMIHTPGHGRNEERVFDK